MIVNCKIKIELSTMKMSKALTLTLANATPTDVDKMLKLGDSLQKKKTPADKAEALQWFLRAAKFGSAEAMCAAGHCFQTGFGLGVEKDNEKAMEWFRRAVAKMDMKKLADDGLGLWFGSRPCRVGVVAMFIAMGGDVNAVDKYGSRLLHNAAAYGHETIAEMLIVAGADVKATDKQGRTARDIASTDRMRELLDNEARRIDTCVVATMFDSSRSALSDARSARRRLASLDVIPPLLAAKGAFDTIGAIGAIDFAGAERSFAEKPDALRSADQLLPEMTTKRDEARQQLAQVATAVIELHDASPANCSMSCVLVLLQRRRH
jgi:hypothetical protein